MTPAQIRIFYPADPVGVVPGGIDTFIRGLIKWAPEDLEFSLVGMSTDPLQRPVGQWSTQVLGSRSFQCFPAVGVADAGQRTRLPLSLRFTAAVWRQRAKLVRGFDVFDFHRPEPSLLFRADQRPKNAYFHNDPAVVGLGASDMLWKHMPKAYRRMEAAAVQTFARVWCVRETGVQTLRQRFPDQAQQIDFIPTWVDSEAFQPPRDEAERRTERQTLTRELGINGQAHWLVSVGRLDTQKDPQLLLAAFTRLVHAGHDVHWLVVGDGRLRPELERLARESGVAGRIHFLGLQSPARIARLLRASDLFGLSSAYEGMPMAALEALGCGLPVVSTDVGEIRRLVLPGRNGLITADRSAECFAAALLQGFQQAPQWRGPAAVAATEPFQPARVLAPAYDSYRRLALPLRRLRTTLQQQQQRDSGKRQRLPVVGVPIDHISRHGAVGRMLHWGRTHQSRLVAFCNVHSVVEARRNERHRLVLESADLSLPDGAPVAWTLGLRSAEGQERIDGPGTMWDLCREAQAQGLRIGLYGATDSTLHKLERQLRRAFPLLDVAYAFAPPFRPLSPEEDAQVCAEVRARGVHLLFVGLGCPKQEAWIADHLDRIPAVMLGVGAAFDMHAGLAMRAPRWMRQLGLEWFHRLLQEPGRLWQRYLSTNSRFVAWSLADALHQRARGAEKAQAGATQGPQVRELMVSSRIDPWEQLTSRMPKFAESVLPSSQLTRMDETAVDELVARVDALLPPRGGRVIEFVASGRGEGTTTIATQFATAHALQWRRRVLLLNVSRRGMVVPSVLQALAAGDDTDELILQRPDGVFTGSLGPASRRHPAWSLLRRTDLWAHLRQQFDLIVLDMPSTDVSRAAFNVAVAADGVVVVVEAERARAPVVHDLIERLRAVRGNVMGTVLNKRRYHLPERLYRWL